jgi:hypothetical protein
MEKLNSELLRQFKEETNLIPTYQKDGSTYHTLKYVNWLESKIKLTNRTCDWCGKDGDLINKTLHRECYEGIMNGEGMC